MPTWVDPSACDGCGTLERPACVDLCPNDLMTLDPSLGRAWNREPELCWECYACVKACPPAAIDVRGSADVVPLGASVTPRRGPDAIEWTVKFRDGRTKRFTFAIRTTPWGSIEPFRGLPAPSVDGARTPGLSGGSIYLGVERLPAPAMSR
jgi:adenylylsulfate reductase subunit B